MWKTIIIILYFVKIILIILFIDYIFYIIDNRYNIS